MLRRRSTRVAEKTAVQVETTIRQPPSKKRRSTMNEAQFGMENLDRKPILKAENGVSGPSSDYVSAYEASIQKNIKERMEMLKMLQIDVIKEEVKMATTGGKPKNRLKAQQSTKSRLAPLAPTPSRRSQRLRGRDPAGAAVPPPPASETDEHEPPPRKLGTETVMSASTGFTAPEETVRQLADIGHQLTRQEPLPDMPGDSYTSALVGLSMAPYPWAKVTPLRITSLAFCPLRQRHVLAAGDKRGVLGLWDVSRGDDGVHMLSAHTAHIVGLTFSPSDGGRCYTSSYDGVSRCLDLQRQQFDQVYATPASEPGLYLNHHTQAGEHVLLLGQSDGQLVRCDLRSQDVSSQSLSDRGLRFLSVHPSREHCLVAVERPSSVSLWDLRQLKGRRSSLQRLTLPRPCAGASVSRRAGDRLVLACKDDTIRLYDGVGHGQLNPTKTIRHDNNTGRWLTPFVPTWLPHSDDLFVVGSMLQPRRMEVYDRHGSLNHLLMDPEMQSICSTIVCHPSQPAIAGGNSSGKVYLYT